MAKRICVLGAGPWGSNHIRTLLEIGVDVGVIEPNPVAQEGLKGMFPDATLVPDLETALGEDYDGFVVATPARTHFEIAMTIIEAEKPLLVEKPLALTAAEAEQLVVAAEKRNVGLMTGHVLLFHPAIQAMHAFIQEGNLGKLQYIYSNRLNLGTVRSEENILWSFAPHDVSIFQHFIGADPVSVHSSGGAFLQPAIHDSTMTVFKYPDNIVGHIFVSWLHPFKEHRLVIVGSKGMLSFEDSSETKDILFYEKGIDWVAGKPLKRDGEIKQVAYERAQPLRAELEYFLGVVDGKPVELASGRSAVDVLRILELATRDLTGADADTAPAPKPETNYFVHESSYVDDGASIGSGTKIWHFSHVQSGAQIGNNCSIGQNVNVGNNVRIGSHVKIQNNVSVYEGVEIEDYVFCGPSMVFTNVIDPRSKYPQRGSEHYRKTLVREGASIGANATIVCGHTIGRHAFIGAGAVVTRDVPDYALMLGVPAVRAGWVCECGEQLPDPGDESVSCARCGIAYGEQGGTLTPSA